MWFGVGIGVQSEPSVQMDYFCDACGVRWRSPAGEKCWSCGSDKDTRNLTASGQTSRYGHVSPSSGAMSGYPSVTEEEE